MEVNVNLQKVEIESYDPEMLTQNGETLFPWKELEWAANAVCKIKISNGNNSSSYGTGWACGRELIITNSHVLDSLATCLKGVAQFIVSDVLVEVPLNPHALYVNSPQLLQGQPGDAQHLDYAIVAVKNDDRLTPVWNHPITLQNWPGPNPKDVLVIGHPKGGEKTISTLGDSKLTTCSQYSIAYHNETDYGSSGSPVLAPLGGKLQVFGLHRARDAVKNENIGVPLSAIITDLNANGAWGQIQAWQLLPPNPTIDWTKFARWVELIEDRPGGGWYHLERELKDGRLMWESYFDYNRNTYTSSSKGTEMSQICLGAPWLNDIIELRNGHVAFVGDYGTITVWDLVNNKKIHNYQGQSYWFQGFQSGVCRLLESTKGHLIATNEVGLIMIWNQSGNLFHTVRGHSKEVRQLLEIDQDHILTTSHDKKIKVWKYPNFTEHAVIETTSKRPSVVTLPGSQFACGYGNGIWVYNPKGESQQHWTIQGFVVTGLERLTDGALVIRGRSLLQNGENYCYQIWTAAGQRQQIIDNCGNDLVELRDGSLATVDYFAQEKQAKLRVVDRAGKVLSNQAVLQLQNDQKDAPYFALNSLSNGDLLISTAKKVTRWTFG